MTNVNINETRKLGGKFTIKIFNKNGTLKTEHSQNLIVDVGKNKLLDQLIGVGTLTDTLNKLEMGSSSQSPTSSDTSLVSPLQPPAKKTADIRQRVNNTITIEVTILSSEYNRPQNINEVGIFWDDDTLFARSVLSTTLILDTGDYARITYTITM